jgi:hypothetical protein
VVGFGVGFVCFFLISGLCELLTTSVNCWFFSFFLLLWDGSAYRVRAQAFYREFIFARNGYFIN